jgi:hypothetical protein
VRYVLRLLFGWLVAATVQAHPLAPALLELRAIDADHYAVLWRTSVTRVQAVDVTPRWPQGCSLTAPMSVALSDDRDAVEERGQLRCADLVGGEIAVEGLDRAGISVILRVEQVTGSVQQALLDARQPGWIVLAPQASIALFADYLVLGVEHLWLGLDHVLFVFGLVLLISGWVRLLWTLTAFTIGHSLTLAAASLGWVDIDARLTEFAIAATLLWLAVEIVSRKGRGWFARFPYALAAGFGLVHGLGFAGVLGELGLPEGEIVLALFSFNLGIELGQIALVAALLLVFHAPRRAQWPAIAARALPAYAVGTLAAYWCFERGAAWWA